MIDLLVLPSHEAVAQFGSLAPAFGGRLVWVRVSTREIMKRQDKTRQARRN